MMQNKIQLRKGKLKMNKDVVLSRAGEELEECIILYMQFIDGDGRVYFDKECTRCLTADEMKEVFTKRCLANVNNAFLLAPIAWATNPDGSASLLFNMNGETLITNSVEHIKS